MYFTHQEVASLTDSISPCNTCARCSGHKSCVVHVSRALLSCSAGRLFGLQWICIRPGPSLCGGPKEQEGKQIMTSWKILMTCILLALGNVAAETRAAVLLVDLTGPSPELLGATGVAVDGALYDVLFVDGSCIALFDGCDAPTDFAFTAQAAAEAAAQA